MFFILYCHHRVVMLHDCNKRHEYNSAIPIFLIQYLSSGELAGQRVIASENDQRKVMGMTLLDNLLYVVYHKTSIVHVYDVTSPAATRDGVSRASIRSINTDMKWPRGIAANVRRSVLYAIDWTRMFSGWLSKMSTTAVLDAQVSIGFLCVKSLD